MHFCTSAPSTKFWHTSESKQQHFKLFRLEWNMQFRLWGKLWFMQTSVCLQAPKFCWLSYILIVGKLKPSVPMTDIHCSPNGRRSETHFIVPTAISQPQNSIKLAGVTWEEESERKRASEPDDNDATATATARWSRPTRRGRGKPPLPPIPLASFCNGILPAPL